MKANRFARCEAAVSDVVGSILLIAITVVVGGLFAVLIFSMPGPVDTTRPDLRIALNPGPDGVWGTGNENISVSHLGGEALSPASTRISLRHSTIQANYTDGLLGGAFGTGAGLSIGETWFGPSTLAIARGEPASITIVAERASAEVLLAVATITAGSSQ